MRLKFNDPEEFLQELRQAPPDVEPVLRLTVRHQLDRGTGAWRHLTVVASFLRRMPGHPTPLLITLEAYQGEDWGREFECSRETRARTEALLAQLREAAGELALECRPGVYEPQQGVSTQPG